jgi:nitrogenase molybdenum-iron protein alpha/beta subunit
MKFSWAGRLPKDDRRYGLFLEKLKKSKEVKVCGALLSPERLKNAFNNYFKEDFGVEYALSQVFSPKQKELFFS